jgi:type IV secretion system protein VirB11
LAASGHPGSITSVHAGSCALALEQMSLMIRESSAGGGLRLDEIKGLLGIVIDVIVQFNRDERGRFISEIAYEPRRKQHTDDATRDAMADAQATLFGGFRT